MKYAWVQNNTVRDVCPGIPEQLYTQDIAALYTEQVPDDIVNGATFENGIWVNPKPIIPSASVVVPPTVTVTKFKLLFTSAERVAISAAKSSDPVIADFYSILDDYRTLEVNLALQTVQEMLGYLISKDLLTAERKDEILTGNLR